MEAKSADMDWERSPEEAPEDRYELSEGSGVVSGKEEGRSSCSSTKDEDLVTSTLGMKPRVSVVDAELLQTFEQNRVRPRVLKLFDMRTFMPIENHEELEGKLSTLGFVVAHHTDRAEDSMKISRWKEYAYGAEGAVLSSSGHFEWWTPWDEVPVPVPRPRLPYPDITMHHPYIYKAFLFLVGMYIGHEKVQEHLQVRSVPHPGVGYDMSEMEVIVKFQESLNILSDWHLAYRRGYVDECTAKIVSEISDFEDANGEIDTSGSLLKLPGLRS